MYKIGDKIELNEGFTATCQKVEDGISIFCMDQYLDKLMKREGLIERINSEEMLEIFGDLKNNLIPFEDGNFLRVPYVEEMFPKTSWIFETMEECHPEISQWELMKNIESRKVERNGKKEWGLLMNRCSESIFAHASSYGDATYYGADTPEGVRLVFRIVDDKLHVEKFKKNDDLSPLIITISSSIDPKYWRGIYKLIEVIKRHSPNAIIYYPLMEGDALLPISKKRRNYIDRIEKSDVLVVISKSDERIEIGESVSWEIAIAEHFNIPVLYMLNKEV